jgi:hypothetical protein
MTKRRVTAVLVGLAALLASGTSFAAFTGAPSSGPSTWTSLSIAPATNIVPTASCGPALSLSAKVVLTWTASTTTQVTGYSIRRRIPPAVATTVGTVGSGVTTFTDSPLLPGTTYGYVIRATRGGFFRDATEVQVTTPTPCL